MRMSSGTVGGFVGESVEGLVEVAGIAARADGDHGQQPCIAGRICAPWLRRSRAPAPGVVEDVRQAVAVGDQVLDGIEPATAFTMGGSFTWLRTDRRVSASPSG
jgi:hypothetical protein